MFKGKSGISGSKYIFIAILLLKLSLKAYMFLSITFYK